MSGIGGCSGDDRHPPGGDFDGGVDYVQPLVPRESRGFTGGAAGDQEIDAAFNLPRDEIAQGRVVEGAVLMKGSDESGATAMQLHRDKIARIGKERNCGRTGCCEAMAESPSGSAPPDSRWRLPLHGSEMV